MSSDHLFCCNNLNSRGIAKKLFILDIATTEDDDDQGCRGESSLQKLISPRPSIFVYGDRSNKLNFFSFHQPNQSHQQKPPDFSQASSSLQRITVWSGQPTQSRSGLVYEYSLVMQRSNDVLKFGTQINPALLLLPQTSRHSAAS